eukprot:XP_011674090.1 PREDICTED: uncharacterized protein LOC105443006 [Strongylocentrotus purpuratus]
MHIMVFGSTSTRGYNASTVQQTTPHLNISRPETAGVTSDKSSTFYIINASRKYQICDRLDVIIEARDSIVHITMGRENLRSCKSRPSSRGCECIETSKGYLPNKMWLQWTIHRDDWK